jgi:hypothetical protein
MTLIVNVLAIFFLSLMGLATDAIYSSAKCPSTAEPGTNFYGNSVDPM